MAEEAEKVEEVEKPDPVVEDEAAKSKEEPEPEKKEGTPDKALQQLQQRAATMERKYDDLMAKVEAGTATPAEVKKAKRALDEITEDLADYDPFDEAKSKKLAGGTVKALKETDSEVQRLSAELAEAKGMIGGLLNAHNWSVARTKFAGLDIDAIWEKANEDAAKTLDDAATPAAVNKLASRWFEERCEAAKKRKGDEDKSATKNKGKESETSPSLYRAGDGNKTAPVLTEEQKALAEALSLVREI